MTADALKKTTTDALDKLTALLDEGQIHLHRGDRAALAESPACVQQTAATIVGPLTAMRSCRPPISRRPTKRDAGFCATGRLHSLTAGVRLWRVRVRC
jgi:hypothetical protein